jgi:heat shock protein HslJ
MKAVKGIKMKIGKLTIMIYIFAVLLSACVDSQSNLDGTYSVLINYNDILPIEGAKPTLQFDSGQVLGNTGCNHYGGTYQINGDFIHFDGIFSTEMACLEPEYLMEQELIYLGLLRKVDQFQLTDHELTFYAKSIPILVFEIQSDEPISIESVLEHGNPAAVEAFPSPTSPPVFTPPEGWNLYWDPVTGISVYIPDGWIVTGIIEGEYAILQSYPVDKYVGGEMREDGDTKCDLSIRPEGVRAEELIEQWKSDSMTTIVSDDEFIFQSGLSGQRLVIDSMGRATVFITEINKRTTLLTCFGDVTQVDEIAMTLTTFE